MRRNIKDSMIMTMIIGITSLSFIIGCRGKGTSANEGKIKEKKPPLVMTQPVKKERISSFLETTGQTIAVNAVTISSTVEGQVAFCPWREGDLVEKKGQRLIEIDRSLYREEVKTAEASLLVSRAKLDDLKAGSRPEEINQAEGSVRDLEESTAFAKNDLDRIAQLVERGALPGEDLEKARVVYVTAQSKLTAAKEKLAMLKSGPTRTAIAIQEALVKEAEAKLSMARAKLAEGILLAPFKGMITKVLVRPGDFATAKSPLMEIIDPASLVIRFSVPEIWASSLRIGMKVLVALDVYPDKVFAAKINRLYPELDTRMRTRTAEAILESGLPLMPGMFARLELVLATVEEAVVVPDQAVKISPQGEQIAFTVNGEKAVRRKIKTGIEEGGKIQILEGLRVGEEVIVAGHEKLKEGQAVRIGKPGQDMAAGGKMTTPSQKGGDKE